MPLSVTCRVEHFNGIRNKRPLKQFYLLKEFNSAFLTSKAQTDKREDENYQLEYSPAYYFTCHYHNSGQFVLGFSV